MKVIGKHAQICINALQHDYEPYSKLFEMAVNDLASAKDRPFDASYQRRQIDLAHQLRLLVKKNPKRTSEAQLKAIRNVASSYADTSKAALPLKLELLHLLGDALLTRHHIDQAEQIRMAIITIMQTLHMSEEARIELQRMNNTDLRKVPRDLLLVRADAWTNLAEYAKAEKILLWLSKTDEVNEAKVYTRLALVYELQSQHLDAINTFRKAVDAMSCGDGAEFLQFLVSTKTPETLLEAVALARGKFPQSIEICLAACPSLGAAHQTTISKEMAETGMDLLLAQKQAPIKDRKLAQLIFNACASTLKNPETTPELLRKQLKCLNLIEVENGDQHIQKIWYTGETHGRLDEAEQALQCLSKLTQPSALLPINYETVNFLRSGLEEYFQLLLRLHPTEVVPRTNEAVAALQQRDTLETGLLLPVFCRNYRAFGLYDHELEVQKKALALIKFASVQSNADVDASNRLFIAELSLAEFYIFYRHYTEAKEFMLQSKEHQPLQALCWPDELEMRKNTEISSSPEEIALRYAAFNRDHPNPSKIWRRWINADCLFDQAMAYKRRGDEEEYKSAIKKSIEAQQSYVEASGNQLPTYRLCFKLFYDNNKSVK